MSAATLRLQALRDEWNKNSRLRLGTLVIAVILLAWLALVLSDLKAASGASLADASERLQKIRALSGQTDWLQREQQAKTLRDALSAEIPAARTAGLAQAAFQTQLGTLVEPFAGKVRVQVSPASADPRVDGVWHVPAALDGELPLAQIHQLLYALETQPNLITIETLSVTNRDKVRFSASVQAYYQLPASEVTHAP